MLGSCVDNNKVFTFISDNISQALGKFFSSKLLRYSSNASTPTLTLNNLDRKSKSHTIF